MSRTRDALILIIGYFLAIAITESFGKGESDEQKWERIAQQKAARRIVEHRYEACMNNCRESCR